MRTYSLLCCQGLLLQVLYVLVTYGEDVETALRTRVRCVTPERREEILQQFDQWRKNHSHLPDVELEKRRENLLEQVRDTCEPVVSENALLPSSAVKVSENVTESDEAVATTDPSIETAAATPGPSHTFAQGTIRVTGPSFIGQLEEPGVLLKAVEHLGTDGRVILITAAGEGQNKHIVNALALVQRLRQFGQEGALILVSRGTVL
ncbi:hypothetical protein CYMTET_31146 [Cymbomonas tetramitiformis]|uniref:Uncharacterized protein n=1 Tax=Cymbomonas tetramitiformis TaxID=36881 RepID=A0AAE0FHT9_9CHLO|nr:hypothetical protein CYMTET_31146 [Cymbomonas tetramitiformis]